MVRRPGAAAALGSRRRGQKHLNYYHLTSSDIIAGVRLLLLIITYNAIVLILHKQAFNELTATPDCHIQRKQ